MSLGGIHPCHVLISGKPTRAKSVLSSLCPYHKMPTLTLSLLSIIRLTFPQKPTLQRHTFPPPRWVGPMKSPTLFCATWTAYSWAGLLHLSRSALLSVMSTLSTIQTNYGGEERRCVRGLVYPVTKLWRNALAKQLLQLVQMPSQLLNFFLLPVHF